jgi:hypothetical protein
MSSFMKELDPELSEHVNAGQILSTPVSQENASARFGALLADLGKL